MATLEQEVLEKYRQLDPKAKQRVRRVINHEIESDSVAAGSGFDFDKWYADLEEIHEKIRQDHGGVFPKIDTVQLLREVRDEE